VRIDTIDLRREWKALYTARQKPDFVDVPPRRGILIRQTVPPGAETMGPVFRALYPVAYALKLAVKAEQEMDYPVLAPEVAFRLPLGAEWEWTAAIAVPEVVTPAMVRRAVAAVREKHPEFALLDELKLRKLPAGTQARIMHIGAYGDEQPTVDRLLAFISESGLRPGRHHIEVYLSDPSRVPPERTRTVIRYPILKGGPR
jgi:hypothetical protein